MEHREYINQKATEPTRDSHGRKGFGAVPDSKDPRDYEYRAVAAAGKTIQLPESISLQELLPSETWDQGDLQSCTSFAANLLIAAAREKEGLPYVRPSFMATWYWTKLAMFGERVAAMDVGCSIREAVLSTKREGIVPEIEWPYDHRFTKNPPNTDVMAIAQANQSLYFFRVDDFERGVDVDFLYRCLAEGWPVSVTLPIHDSFKPDYNTGMVPSPTPYDKFEGYHAMVLYGYYLTGRRPYFKCRNSWGKWGGRHINPSGKQLEAGNCRIPVEYVQEHGYDCWTIRAVESGKIEGVPLEEVVSG